MTAKSDSQLLCEFCRGGSEDAFKVIVERYTDFVYSSALRQVGLLPEAHDIAQVVFSDLAKKAPSLVRSLPENGSLAGWLFRSTRYAALNELRNSRRREARERQIMEDDLKPDSNDTNDWELIRPLLDEAMADLSEQDKAVLLLRFFKDRNFQAIGKSLGVSDDTAQKRVSRALERLRARLKKRGVTTSAVTLSTVLGANAVASAPTGLAAVLSSTALAGTTLATTATGAAIVMTTFKKALIGTAMATAIAVATFEARQGSALRTQFVTSIPESQVETESARRNSQTNSLAEQINPELIRERDDAVKKLALLRGEIARLNENTAELLRLRGEVGQLRQQVSELTKPPQEPLYTRQYKVNGGYLRTNLNFVAQFGGDSSLPASATEDEPPSERLRTFFEQNGIVFKAPESEGPTAVPPGQSVPLPAFFFNEQTDTLFARTTMSTLDQIESLVQFLNMRPSKK